MTYTACSFTGHRKIEDRHKERIGGLLFRAIRYAYGLGCRDFFCGGALGFDTAAAKEVIRFRMSHPDCRLGLLLPCRDQSSAWREDEIRLYEYILSEADTVLYASDEYTEGCMRERNRRLAEAADVVIAYVGRERSGAGQTVRIAKSLGREVYNLYLALDKEEKQVSEN
ncbi:MAG: DUF1273 family protein [Clostridia bacterium]|nr:DUF1273 family protein [Clostridia bacterium]